MDNIDMRTKREIWRGHFEDWKASGLTKREWCRRNEINYKQFGYWSRKFRDRAISGGTDNVADGKEADSSSGYDFYEVSFSGGQEHTDSGERTISERMKPELAIQFKSYLLYINNGVSQGTLQTVMEVLNNA